MLLVAFGFCMSIRKVSGIDCSTGESVTFSVPATLSTFLPQQPVIVDEEHGGRRFARVVCRHLVRFSEEGSLRVHENSPKKEESGTIL